MPIILKTSGEAIRGPAEIFAYLITLAVLTAAILARVLSCLNWLWRTGKLAWLQMVSIGALIEEETRIIVPVKKAFETLVLCLLQGRPRSRCHSLPYLLYGRGMGCGSLQWSLPEVQFSCRAGRRKCCLIVYKRALGGGGREGKGGHFPVLSAFYLPYLNLLEEKVFTKMTSFSLTFLGHYVVGVVFLLLKRSF